jgi:hypothetical protein
MRNREPVTVEQARQRLGVGRGTLLELARRYQVPRFEDPSGGGRTMFRLPDLDRLQEPLRRVAAARKSKTRFTG